MVWDSLSCSVIPYLCDYSVTFTKHYLLRSYNYPPYGTLSLFLFCQLLYYFYNPKTFPVFYSLILCNFVFLVSHPASPAPPPPLLYFYHPSPSFPSFLSFVPPLFFSSLCLYLVLSTFPPTFPPSTLLPFIIYHTLSLFSYHSLLFRPAFLLLCTRYCSNGHVSCPSFHPLGF